MQFPSPRIETSSNRSNIDKLNLSSSSSSLDHSDSIYNRNQDWQPIFHSTVGYRKIEKHSLFRKPIVPTPKSDLHTSKTL